MLVFGSVVRLGEEKRDIFFDVFLYDNWELYHVGTPDSWRSEDRCEHVKPI